MKQLTTITIIILAVLFTAGNSVAQQYYGHYGIGRMPGAKIKHGSCDPTADPALDNVGNKPLQERSCIGQGIDRNNFTVWVSFNPTQPITDEDGNPWPASTVANNATPVLPSGITTVYDGTTNNPISVQANNPNQFTYLGVGRPVLYNNQAVYGPPGPQRWPFSPASGAPIPLQNNGVNQVYASASGTAGACIVGNVVYYPLAGHAVRDRNCNNVLNANNSIAYAGGAMLNSSGGQIIVRGSPILAVAAPMSSSTTQIAGNLYNMVFQDNSDDVKNQIAVLTNKEEELRVGQTLIIHPETRVTFELVYEGNRACVYAYEDDASKRWRVGKLTGRTPPATNVDTEVPASLNEVYDILDEDAMDPDEQPDSEADLTKYGITNDHCVFAPPPTVSNIPLVWNSLISPICTNYGSGHAQFRTPFTSAVVECIEDTMLGIFYPTASSGGQIQQTFFSNLQSRVQNVIRALLALYVIFFGYKLMMGKAVPKREEWMWLGIKMALVIYFALGSGMMEMLPRFLNVSKSLSVMVMEAGLGRVNDAAITQAQSTAANAWDTVNTKRSDFNTVSLQLDSARSRLAQIDADIATTTAALNNARVLRDSADTERAYTLTLYNAAASGISNMQSVISSVTSAVSGDITTAQANFSNTNRSRAYSNFGGAYYKTPAFCTQIEAEVWGGGSAGSWVLGTTSSDYSGGAGGYAKGRQTIRAGQTFSVSVGSGGRLLGSNGGQSWFLSSNFLYANGGQGKNGGTAGGTGAVASANGGNGASSACTTIAGGNPFGGGGQPSSSCNPNGNTALAGGAGAGGCSSDDTCANRKWGWGTNGKVQVTCTNFDFTNFTNVDSTDSTQINFRDDLQRKVGILQQLQSQSYVNGSIAQGSLASQLQTAYNSAMARFNTYSGNFNTINGNLGTLQGNRNTIQQDVDRLTNDYNTKQSALDIAISGANIAENSLMNLFNGSTSTGGTATYNPTNSGYAYCDFRSYNYGNKPHLKLWDMIDCRMSRYLGIGSNISKPDVPQILLIASLAPFTVGFGIPIFICAIIFMMTTIMIIVRAVHIYIMAFVGLLLLVYISPLVIPAALFEFTKSMFQSWMGQVMGFILQPVMLFAFLSFMFAVTDHVMYGNNHDFNGNNLLVNSYGVVSPTNKACSVNDSKCKDPNAVGYIFQTLEITKKKWPRNEFSVFEMQSLDFGTDEGKGLMVGLAKLCLLSFVVYSVLVMIESLSAKLVGVMGGGGRGVGDMSAAPVVAPSAALQAMTEGAAKAKDVAWSGIKAAPGAAYAGGKAAVAGAKKVARGAAYVASGEIAKDMEKSFNKLQSKAENFQAADLLPGALGDRLRDDQAKAAVMQHQRNEQKENVANQAKMASQEMQRQANKGPDLSGARGAAAKAEAGKAGVNMGSRGDALKKSLMGGDGSSSGGGAGSGAGSGGAVRKGVGSGVGSGASGISEPSAPPLADISGTSTGDSLPEAPGGIKPSAPPLSPRPSKEAVAGALNNIAGPDIPEAPSAPPPPLPPRPDKSGGIGKRPPINTGVKKPEDK